MEVNPNIEALAEMKSMNIPKDAVIKVQETLEGQARDKVRDIQGGYCLRNDGLNI